VKLRSFDRIELLLGVVQVVDVNRGEPQVFPAALDLVGEVARREAVAAGDDVIGCHHSRTVVLVLEKSPVTLFRRGRSAIERDVPTLAAHHDLVAGDGSARDATAQRVTQRALRALAPVIDRGIQQVDPVRQRLRRGGSVARIFRVVAVAQIRSHAQRGHDGAADEWPVEMIVMRGGESLSKSVRTLGRRAPIDE
jgi:hypothetical protein